MLLREQRKTTKKAHERYQNLGENNIIMGVNNIKIYMKMKNKGWLSIE